MNILKHSIVFAFIVVALLGCRRKLEEPPVFPAAEYFSPSVVNNSDAELSIYGINLDETKVSIGGKDASIVSLSDDKTVLKVKMPTGIPEGKYIVAVTLNDGSVIEFTAPLVFDETSVCLKQDLLIGDFDGGGIRAANTTSNFSDGAWIGDPGANSEAGILSSINGVTSSPAGGNFVYMTVPGGGILPNTFGYVAALISRNEIQNDLSTAWPESFIDYGAPNNAIKIDEGFDVVADFYINFYANFNGLEKGQVRIYLGNSDLPDAQKFAYTLSYNSLSNKEGWNLISVKFSEFKCNFGFGGGSGDVPCTIDMEYLQKINQVSFSVSDNFNNDYKTPCCKGASIDCCNEKIVDPVEVYIDHVTLTKGCPAYDYSSN